jgi:hypothetical protein
MQNMSVHATGDSNAQAEDRVEPVPKPEFPHHLYPMWIGHKFEPDGKLLPFPGNTIICHLDPTSQLYQALLGLYDALKSQDFADLYVLLPPESWHMTLFEGVSDQIRKRSSWPADLALDSSLSECTSLLRSKLVDFDLGTNPPFEMTVDGYDPLTEGIALKVVATTAAEDGRIRGVRDRLSKHLLMRHPGHESYSFHISLAYLLCRLDQEQLDKLASFLKTYQSRLPQRFELGGPEFCVFNDMFAFKRQFYLNSSRSLSTGAEKGKTNASQWPEIYQVSM